MKTRQTSGIVISMFFIAWAAAFPASAIGVLGLVTELSRPPARRPGGP